VRKDRNGPLNVDKKLRLRKLVDLSPSW